MGIVPAGVAVGAQANTGRMASIMIIDTPSQTMFLFFTLKPPAYTDRVFYVLYALIADILIYCNVLSQYPSSEESRLPVDRGTRKNRSLLF
jgi:hypothetical protein